MAAFNKFETFAGDLGNGVHNLNSDTLEVYLTNAAPSASADSVKADLAEIATGNGYTGPVDVQNTFSEASGTGTLSGTKVTITASGGDIATFQHVVLQNTTPTSPADPLIGYWSEASAIDLTDGSTYNIKFNNSETTGSILTIA